MRYVFTVLLSKDVFVAIFVCIVYRLIRKEIGRMSQRARVSINTKQVIGVRKAQKKLIFTMCLVLVTFLFSYAPYITLWNWLQIDPHFKERHDAYVIIHYAEVMTMTKPIWNAFVYYFRLKAVRYCCMEQFRKIFCGNSINPADSP